MCFVRAACGFDCQCWLQIFPKSQQCGHGCVFRRGCSDACAKESLYYEYIDYFSRLDEPALPPREVFCQQARKRKVLTGVLRSRPSRVEKLPLPVSKKYMARYLQSDICLLADMFHAIRNNSLGEYQLDPAYFESASQLAWNVYLKHIDRPIPLINDPKMYRIIKPNIRGIS